MSISLSVQTIEEAGSKEDIVYECMCCCEKFTKSTHAVINCTNSDCNYKVCKQCVRTYLMNTTQDPHCMECKTAWTQQFVVSQLNRSWFNNTYKKHRKQLLIEREMSKMPETMPQAMIYKDLEELKFQDGAIVRKIRELRQEIQILNNQRNEIYQKQYNLRWGNNSSQKDEGPKFIMPCPDEHCRGFLSTAYKCEICKIYACPKCLEQIGENRHDNDHVCNPDMVKSAQLIKDTSKPCPTCGERIIKASGCDQMWCTKCHTAFSWKTGKIDKGMVHNPHFFQYQQTANNGAVARNPGDVACGGLPGRNRYRVRNKIRTIMLDEDCKNTCSYKKGEGVPECLCYSIVEKNNAYAVPNPSQDIKIPLKVFHTDLTHMFSELYRLIAHVTHYELDLSLIHI